MEIDREKKAAEILVQDGRYVYKEYEEGVRLLSVIDPNWPSQSGYRNCILDPFKHDVDGINQAHIIEDYLAQKKKHLWLSSMGQFGFDDRPRHQWRLDRIKWCLAQLTEQQHGAE